ncbi:carbohydrate ABC transporter permease [Ruania alkalisoli]|uniref:Carbohydrate ABC transporter permease n=1 Tax=Ruania alkalisoli TaxID=2779775 RepID=A0A7M1SSZ1_9MICO|nr:carbohydrate ABC transporter permease [Ruania alkalisoli]QOR70571.1 carbohydrate ABC transporter permease [Ruania alkalisoli]
MSATAALKASGLRGQGIARWAGVAFLAAILAVWVYPFLWMIATAFKPNSEVFARSGLMPRQFTLENFARAWWDANIANSFMNSVIVAVGTVTIVLVTTAMIGYSLGRFAFPGRKMIFALLVASAFVPEGYTIIPIYKLLDALALNESLWGIILAEAGGGHVLFILLFAGYFSQVPRELADAAAIDGAGFSRTFVSVMLPLARPVVATTVVLQFMNSWNSYFLPLVLTLTRPELQTLGVAMKVFQGEFFSDWAGLAAAATISQLPIIVIFLCVQRFFIDGISGAVKG